MSCSLAGSRRGWTGRSRRFGSCIADAPCQLALAIEVAVLELSFYNCSEYCRLMSYDVGGKLTAIVNVVACCRRS